MSFRIEEVGSLKFEVVAEVFEKFINFRNLETIVMSDNLMTHLKVGKGIKSLFVSSSSSGNHYDGLVRLMSHLCWLEVVYIHIWRLISWLQIFLVIKSPGRFLKPQYTYQLQIKNA